MTNLKMICATIAPFTPDGELDRDGVSLLFNNLKNSGVDYVFTPGTTAEFTALSEEERLTMISAALNVFGPDGVFAHVGAPTSRQAVDLARKAKALGATRMAAITPYFVTAGPTSVVEYYRAITAAVPNTKVYAYIFPDRATTHVSPETLASVAEIPGMAGVKLSGMSTDVVATYIKAVPANFEVYSGNDREVIRLAAHGGAGIVSGISNVYPDVFVQAVNALNNGEDASGLQPQIDDAVASVRGGDIGLLKAGVALRGLPAGPLRVSIEPATSDDLELLKTILTRKAETVR